MLIRTLYFEQANIIAAVVCSLIVAGLLKGTIGVGMPVVALPLLSLFIQFSWLDIHRRCSRHENISGGSSGGRAASAFNFKARTGVWLA